MDISLKGWPNVLIISLLKHYRFTMSTAVDLLSRLIKSIMYCSRNQNLQPIQVQSLWTDRNHYPNSLCILSVLNSPFTPGENPTIHTTFCYATTQMGRIYDHVGCCNVATGLYSLCTAFRGRDSRGEIPYYNLLSIRSESRAEGRIWILCYISHYFL